MLEEIKLANALMKITYKCNCGHSVIIAHPKTYEICTWCGNKVYKNKKEEFKDKLVKTIRRTYANNSTVYRCK